MIHLSWIRSLIISSNSSNLLKMNCHLAITSVQQHTSHTNEQWIPIDALVLIPWFHFEWPIHSGMTWPQQKHLGPVWSIAFLLSFISTTVVVGIFYCTSVFKGYILIDFLPPWMTLISDCWYVDGTSANHKKKPIMLTRHFFLTFAGRPNLQGHSPSSKDVGYVPCIHVSCQGKARRTRISVSSLACLYASGD